MRAKLDASSWDLDRRSFSRRIMVLLNGTAELCDQDTVLTEGDEIV
jgi:molybdopterin converting factor small subunit